MDWNYTTYTAPLIMEPPMTLSSLLELGKKMQKVKDDALENAKVLHMLLTQQYGEIFLPPEQWPFYGIGLDMSKPGAIELIEAVEAARPHPLTKGAPE